MSTVTSVLLSLTLLLTGAYAGMILMCQIGVLPAMRQLSLGAYADAWRAMDTYMDRLMPPYKGSLLLINTATLILLAFQRRTPLAAAAAVSLICSVSGLVLTVRQQLPLNAKLKTFKAGAPDSVLLDIREQTVKGFTSRCFLAAAAFLALCVGVVFSPVR